MSNNITNQIPSSIQSCRTLTLGSQCQIEYIYDTQTLSIIPVLMLTGLKAEYAGPDYVKSSQANAYAGIIQTGYDKTLQSTYINVKGPNDGDPIQINAKDVNDSGDWLNITEEDVINNRYQIIYPRAVINSLGLRTDSLSLVLKYYDITKSQFDKLYQQLSLLEQYEDYSILTRSLKQQYILTLKNDLILKNNYIKSLQNNIFQFETRPLQLNYTISNADVSIYLDALEVAKENSIPKVSYDMTMELINPYLMQNIYNKMGYLTRINDEDLKFENIYGYISGFTLDLDDPSQDTIEVKNYKNKFQDLFSTITAQTEAMKKNSYTLQLANAAFTSSGQLSQEVLQSSIMKVDLNYAFNNGKLTIDEQNGIWGTSDSGVVAFRGGGIFTATEKDTEDNWKWNTGITPEGINADLITSGQLDTNLIKIYAGDHLRFQMNGDGIFAYKSWIIDNDVSLNSDLHPIVKKRLQQLYEIQKTRTLTVAEQEELRELEQRLLSPEQSLDPKQYVLFNENGLSLIAKKGAQVLVNGNDYYTVLNDQILNEHGQLYDVDGITRVEVSWRGLILRNWLNQEVFFADPETGNLTISGRIEATEGHIGAWSFDSHKIWADSDASSIDENGQKIYTTFVALNAGGTNQDLLVHGNDNTPYTKADGTELIVSTKEYCFWAGNANPQTASFFIKKNGSFRATQGQIGGWTLTANFLYRNQSVVLAPGGQKGKITVVTKPAEYDEEGNITIPAETSEVDLYGVVMWAPGPTSSENIVQSLTNAKLKISNTGVIQAEKINNWSKNTFKNGKAYSHATASGHKLYIYSYDEDGGLVKEGPFDLAAGILPYCYNLKGSGETSGSLGITLAAGWPKSGGYDMVTGSNTNDRISISGAISQADSSVFIISVEGPGSDGGIFHRDIRVSI